MTTIELAIIGGGPAGLTAGLYATRGGLKDVILFETGMPGGQITQSSEIENYPGITDVVTGMELMQKWPEQCTKFGLKINMESVVFVKDYENNKFLIKTQKDEYVAKSVIIATGSVPKKAKIKGEDEFFGKGVSTCATCDGFFYKNKDVAVIGGGDTALEEALYLANICNKVYLIHRRDTFKASPTIVKKVEQNQKIELVLNAKTEEIVGDTMGVNGVKIFDKITKNHKIIDVMGAFIFVGRDVKNDVLKNENGYICDVNENGEVIVDLKMQTSKPGLFAAGDIRIDAPKQVVCAAGDGATAGISAISYIESLKD